MIIKKVSVDENTIDYVLYSPTEEVFINVVYDKQFVITLTNVSVVNVADKEEIHSGRMKLTGKEYKGTLGYFMAMTNVMGYVLAKIEKGVGYLENDVLDLTKMIIKDVNFLREKSEGSVDTSWKGKRLKKRLDAVYNGRLDD